MAKRLINLTWAEMQAEMSIAGNPEKIGQLGNVVWDLISQTIDFTNAAELINVQFAIQRIQAEIKGEMKRYEERTGQKIT